jgi:hypothetical protein
MTANKNESLELDIHSREFINKLNDLIGNNSKKEVKEKLKQYNIESLRNIRNKLAVNFFKEFNIKEGDIIIKNRKGNRVVDAYLEENFQYH